jgi:hypothetical protein
MNPSSHNIGLKMMKWRTIMTLSMMNGMAILFPSSTWGITMMKIGKLINYIKSLMNILMAGEEPEKSVFSKKN